jgi:hypothetical protein
MRAITIAHLFAKFARVTKNTKGKQMFRLVNVTALVVGGLYVSYAIHDAGQYFFANVLFTVFLAVAILSIGATKN